MTENTPRSVTVERTATGHFTATNPRGGTISFGTSSDPHGGTDFTPVELLLAAIGGSTTCLKGGSDRGGSHGRRRRRLS
jgi:hypothetical protein